MTGEGHGSSGGSIWRTNQNKNKKILIMKNTTVAVFDSLQQKPEH